MAASATVTNAVINLKTNPKTNNSIRSQTTHCLISTFSLESKSHFLAKSTASFSVIKTRSTPDRIGASVVTHCLVSNPSIASEYFDVVIIGAGIIGLTIARQLLVESNLSVAVVDRAVPCSGATGAGQGYIWMAHKTPGSDIWELAMRSHKLWKMLAGSLEDQGMDPLEVLGWKKTGSLLVGKTPEEAAVLRRRVDQLAQAGLEAEFLSSDELQMVEPALMVENEGGAMLLADDCQLDAHITVSYIEKTNRSYASKGRYAEFYNHSVMRLLRSESTGKLEGVQTSKKVLYSKKAIVVAAGCWSGSLMHGLIKESGVVLNVPVEPRKGHLLLLENCTPFQLNHGVMEAGYVDHQIRTQSTDPSALVDNDQRLSISMTATMDPDGNLLLGSSRQFVGFNTEVDESIIGHIWDRAGEFFPALRSLRRADVNNGAKIRIGLRPYMPDGKPVIGPVPGLSKMFLATGHEGGGLSMALGTAEMVANMVLGKNGEVDYSPFSVQGRCC